MQDLSDEVLMRIMCGVHMPQQHWMHHIAGVARLATVCRRLRYVLLLTISALLTTLLHSIDKGIRQRIWQD